MANGNLKCVGSSFFLKKQFGCGYHLVCVKKPNCDAEKITSLLKLYMPDVKVESDVGTELSYQLSDKCSHLFSKIFSELEIRSHELGVDSYGVSLTTLEEVFMKVGAQPECCVLISIGKQNVSENAFISLMSAMFDFL